MTNPNTPPSDAEIEAVRGRTDVRTQYYSVGKIDQMASATNDDVALLLRAYDGVKGELVRTNELLIAYETKIASLHTRAERAESALAEQKAQRDILVEHVEKLAGEAVGTMAFVDACNALAAMQPRTAEPQWCPLCETMRGPGEITMCLGVTDYGGTAGITRTPCPLKALRPTPSQEKSDHER